MYARTHTHTQIKQTASVRSARCWRHIRFYSRVGGLPAAALSHRQFWFIYQPSTAPARSLAAATKSAARPLEGHQQFAQAVRRGKTHLDFWELTSLVNQPSLKMTKC